MPTPVSYASPVDHFRFTALKRSLAIESFSGSWAIYRAGIRRALGSVPTAETVFRLGDHLSEIFTGAGGGRGQGELISAGANWECLAVWYLNLVLWGSDVIAVRGLKELSPTPARDALTVTISNTRASRETDVLVFSVPNADQLPISPSIEDLSRQIAAAPNATDLAVIQCKTNWKENAQIPMLWNMVYEASRQNRSLGPARVGTGGYAPRNFGRFTYAFLTVPTGADTFQQNHAPVRRVQHLSGGNYWGRPRQDSVAEGFSEYVPTNFGAHLSGSSQTHIAQHLLPQPDVLRRFLALDFDA